MLISKEVKNNLGRYKNFPFFVIIVFKEVLIMKKTFKKILYPNNLIGFIIFNFSFSLLIYVFINHLEETFIAYISYFLSFYALIIFCLWFYKVCSFSNNFIKSHKLYKLYKENFLTITKISIYFSLFINLIYGIFELIIGIYFNSWWFKTFAIYYLILCFMKISLVKSLKNNSHKEYQKLKLTGIILLFLNLILMGIVLLIIIKNEVVHYQGIIVYIVAIYDFYLIISAIINVFKYRKDNRPIIMASKCLNLTIAMISMVSLEVAMVYQFGNNEAEFKRVMSACMGFGICVINSFMGIYMIKNANKKLKNI